VSPLGPPRRGGGGRRRWWPWGGPPRGPAQAVGARPPKPGACGRNEPDRLDYLMPDRAMQPRRGQPALPCVRQSRAPPGGGCDFSPRKRTRQPAARMRPRSPEQDARVTAPSPACMFAAPPVPQAVSAFWDGLQRTVHLNRCRGCGLSSEPPVALRASVRRHRSSFGVASGLSVARSAVMAPDPALR
jgi:hypothetical protein